MKNLLLLLIVLTLFGALVFFGLSIYEGSKDDDNKTVTNEDNDNNTGGNDTGGGGTDNNGFKPSTPSTGNGNAGGGTDTGGGTGANDEDTGTADGGTGTTDDSGTGTETEGDGGNLPSTALISDTADKILISIVVILFGAVLIRTNLLGKLFFPLSEYFQADFFNIDSNDPRNEKRLQRQLRLINEAIQRRGS